MRGKISCISPLTVKQCETWRTIVIKIKDAILAHCANPVQYNWYTLSKINEKNKVYDVPVLRYKYIYNGSG